MSLWRVARTGVRKLLRGLVERGRRPKLPLQTTE